MSFVKITLMLAALVKALLGAPFFAEATQGAHAETQRRRGLGFAGLGLGGIERFVGITGFCARSGLLSGESGSGLRAVQGAFGAGGLEVLG